MATETLQDTVGSPDGRSSPQRDLLVDFIKIIACFFVVGIHAIDKNLSLFHSTLNYVFTCAIPLFWMASGAFLMNKSN